VDNLRLIRDVVHVRELPAPSASQLLWTPPDAADNKTPGSVIPGIVTAVGPDVTQVAVGDRVWYEVEMGFARLPGDTDTRVMREDDIFGVEL
jgi:NADPH:quinone reductase-like Zn-dependent oxidoreductase